MYIYVFKLMPHTQTVVIGTSITLDPENRSNFSFLTQLQNVTVKLNDQYQMFIMVNNSIPGSSIGVTFGGDPDSSVLIRTKFDKPNNITFDVEQREICTNPGGSDCIHVFLLSLTFDNTTLKEFLSIANCSRLVAVKFCVRTLCESHAYIELITDSETEPGICSRSTESNTSEYSSTSSATTSWSYSSLQLYENSTHSNEAVTSHRMHSFYISVFFCLLSVTH